MKKIISLMNPLDTNVCVFPGDPEPKLHRVFSEISKTGYQHHEYLVGDHVFHPHWDAQTHQNIIPAGEKSKEYTPEYWSNPSFLIDLSKVPEAKDFDGIKYLAKITKKHLEAFTELFQTKGAVLIRTGYDKWLEENRPHIGENLPYFEKEAAEWIASFENIRVVGIDSLTIDPPGIHFAHWALKEKLIGESFPYLYKIPLESKENFTLISIPIVIKKATGGPLAAAAVIE